MWNDPSTEAIKVIEGSYSLTLHLSLLDGFNFWLSGIYGQNKSVDRASLWVEYMTSLIFVLTIGF